MRVKIDTREKFHVITILDNELTANMTADIKSSLLEWLQNDVKNLVINAGNVTSIDSDVAEALAEIHETFYEHNASFVVCALQPKVEESLDDAQLLEALNVTPTESEAWDIVQMEEIEREMFGDES